MECAICMEFLTSPADHQSNNVEQSQNPTPAPAPNDAFLASRSLWDLSCTPCGHLFHTKCLQNWLSSNKTCPNCRKRTTTKKIIQVAQQRVTVQENGKPVYPPPDLRDCLSDNVEELREQHCTLIADYNQLKHGYLIGQQQLGDVNSSVDKLQHDINRMRAECEALKEAQSVKGKRRGGKRRLD